MDDPQSLAATETSLIHVLETSDPPRDASLFNITEAARDYHATTGDWDVSGADPQVLEDLLARHAK